MKVIQAFDSRRTVCWATTFTFDPGYFETFLFRRLGEPPLNATVLVDHTKLASTWQRFEPSDTWRTRRANRDYLVRGVAWRSGAFHAKTFLLGNPKSGTLLVGSGNVGLSGLDHGREVFARFETTEDGDRGAFATWRGWMEGLVRQIDDPQVRHRWADLLGRLPWLAEVDGKGAFVTNAARPLLDQLADGVDGTVDELVMTAPFFDHGLQALTAAVDRFRPSRLRILLGEGTSVHGPDLRGFLERFGGTYEVSRFLPRAYVHGKLVGIANGGSSRVLAGSANLSGPALLRTADEGNVEAGVIVSGSSDRAAAWYMPGDGYEPFDLAQIEQLRLVPIDPAPTGLLHLRSAHLQRDHRVAIDLVGATAPIDAVLSDGRTRWVMAGSATSEPVDLADRPLLWLQDDVGNALSNRVPLDDRAALDNVLELRSESSDRPSELDWQDAEHPVGQLLLELYRGALFDIDESPAAKRAAALAAADSTGDSTFWDDYIREQIHLDPRHSRYSPWAGTSTGIPPVDDFRWLIEQMLAKAPKPGELRLIDGTVHTAAEHEETGKRWEPSRKTIASALRVLKRWAQLLSDDRVRWWIADYAPVDHYERLIATILQIWVQGPTWPDAHPTLPGRLGDVLLVALEAFVRPGRGYLGKLEATERERALELIATGKSGSLTAALAYAALAKTPAACYFAWQASLIEALATSVIDVTPATVELVEQLTQTRPAMAAIDSRFKLVSTYTDNFHWAAQVASEVGLDKVEVVPSGHPAFATGIQVEEGIDLLLDPRVVGLVRRALTYKDAGSMRMKSGGAILAAAIGKAAYVSSGTRSYVTRHPISLELLEELELAGGNLAAVSDEFEGSAAAPA